MHKYYTVYVSMILSGSRSFCHGLLSWHIPLLLNNLPRFNLH